MSSARLVENDHTVWILGAGFSAAWGIPVMSGFLHKMRDAHPWLIDRDRHDEADAIKKVLEFRLEASKAAYRVPVDVENIEHLFSLASARPGKDLHDALPTAICTTIDYADETGRSPRRPFRVPPVNSALMPPGWVPHAARAGVPPTHDASAYEIAAGLMAGWPGNRAHAKRSTIITFNYDLLLERSLAHLGVPVQYGLGVGSLEDESASELYVPAGKPLTAPAAKTDALPVTVLKLHGSMNWTAENETVRVFGNYLALREAGQRPFVIPPTWRKVFGGPLQQVWDEAVAALHSATRVFIVGFSIPDTDLHFRYLLAAALMDNISLRIVHVVDVNAEAEPMASRVKGLLRDSVTVRCHAVPAIDFVCSEGHRDKYNAWLPPGWSF